MEYYSALIGLPRWFSDKKNLPANAGGARDTGLSPGSGRFPGERHGNPLQYSCLGNSMDRGTQRATYSSCGRKRIGHDLATKQQVKCLKQKLTYIKCSVNISYYYYFLKYCDTRRGKDWADTRFLDYGKDFASMYPNKTFTMYLNNMAFWGLPRWSSS